MDESDSLIHIESKKKHTTSRRKCICAIALPSAALIIIAIIVPLIITVANSAEVLTANQRVERILQSTPLIDGHNDLPYAIRRKLNNSLNAANLSGIPNPVPGLSTDMARMRKGMMGGQFWADYVFCDSQYIDAVRIAMEQASLIKRMVKQYNDTLEFVTTADGIWHAFNRSRIASLIGMEGGHMIDSSLSTLRSFYDLGVRYMTLTHSCSTPWADASPVDDPTYNGTKLGGLTDFGRKLVLEMNRLGMIIDLSHVSKQVQIDVLNITRAPVMYSHSSAYAICNHHRNVHDDVIELVKKNRGVIMVNSYPGFVNCSETASIEQIADHVEYIKNLCGSDCVGIGGDFDGIEAVSTGFEDVSKYPDLLIELINKYNWSDDDLRNFVGLNVIRVFRQVEAVRDQLSNWPVDESIIPKIELRNTTCRVDW